MYKISILQLFLFCASANGGGVCGIIAEIMHIYDWVRVSKGEAGLPHRLRRDWLLRSPAAAPLTPIPSARRGGPCKPTTQEATAWPLLFFHTSTDKPACRCRHKKTRRCLRHLLALLVCGERGIRTLDTLLRCTHFPGALLKPLGHLSIISLFRTLPSGYRHKSGRKIRIIFVFHPTCAFLFLFHPSKHHFLHLQYPENKKVDRPISLPFRSSNMSLDYLPNSPQIDLLSILALREGLCSAAKTYIIFVTAASVVISLPLMTPIFCNATPVS